MRCVVFVGGLYVGGLVGSVRVYVGGVVVGLCVGGVVGGL